MPAQHSLPAAPPARHRSPAEPKVGILPRKKVSRLTSKPTTVKKFPVVLWGQLSKVSANLPGIEASCQARAKVGILPPRSGFRLRSTPRSVFRLRFSFRFCPKNPAEAMRWGAHRFRSWVSSRKTHHRASAEGPSAMLSSQYR